MCQDQQAITRKARLSLLLLCSAASTNAQFFNTTTNANLGASLFFKTSPAESPSLNYAFDNLQGNHSKTAFYFLCPEQNVAQPGPNIYRTNGDLVWNGFVDGWEGSMSFGPQSYKGETLLTVFSAQGLQGLGHANGTYSFLDNHYQNVFNITGNFSGYAADVHEVEITPKNTVLTTSYESVPYNLTAYGGPEDGWLTISHVQEIEPETGERLFAWNPLEHVNLSDSKAPFFPGLNGTAPGAPWDPVHVNSAQMIGNGNILISARHYSTLFYINGTTGSIIWRLGGSNSSFVLSEDAQFFWQHDARFVSEDASSLTLYNNGASNWAKTQNVSAGLWVDLHYENMTASLRHRYQVWDNASTSAAGSVQLLEDGNVFIGQGAVAAFGEYAANGTALYGVTFGGSSGGSSYRAFKNDWHGYPLTSPNLKVFQENATAYVSWNGATDVDSWILRGSRDNTTYTWISTVSNSGFETQLPLGAANFTYYTATAYDSSNKTLGLGNVALQAVTAKLFPRRVVSLEA